MSKIPHTLQRLGQSLGLLSAHQVNDGIIPDLQTVLNDPASLLEFAKSSRTLGAAYGFKVSQTRRNIRRYGIDAGVEPFAIVPGQAEYILELQMAVLYIQDALQAFDFAGGSIVNQTRPLIINEIVTAPDIDVINLLPKFAQKGDVGRLLSGAVKLSDIPIIHTYVGCWFNDSQMEYTLDGDQAVMQSVRLDVARIINPNVLETGVALGQRQLAKNLGLVPSAIRTAGSTLGI